MSALEHAAKDAPTQGPGALVLLRPIVLSSLWRFRWLLAFGMVVGAGVGLFRGLVAPNQFKSMGKLFVSPGVREALLDGTVVSTRVSGSREAVQNVMQLLSAPEYFAGVVKTVGPDTVLAPYDPAKDAGEASWHKALFHNFQSWWFAGGSGAQLVPAAVGYAEIAAQALERSLWMVPEPNSSVIAFHYVSHTPELAKSVVDGALDAAIEWHGKVFTKLSPLENFESALVKAVSARDEAATKLREFRAKKGVADYEGERARLSGIVNDLRAKLRTVTIDAKSVRAALEAQEEHLRTLPARLLTPQSVENPEVAATASSLIRLRDEVRVIERSEASAETKRAQRSRLEEQIKELEARIASLPLTVQAEPLDLPNPAHQKVAEQIAELRASARSKESERDEVAAQLATHELRSAEVEAMAPELVALEKDAKRTEEYAEFWKSNVSNLTNVQDLEGQKVSSLVVLHHGTQDGIKIGPRRGMLVGVGVVMGLAAAMALVVALALFDRRVRHREDLLRMGLADEGVLVSGGGGSGMPWMLPSSLAEIRDDIARFWAALPYERRQAHGLRIGFVPCGEGASAGRAAAALALGLAAHAGEKVCYVSTLEGPTWLGQRLGLDHQCGWSEVLRGEFPLEDAVVATPVSGLHYLPAGKIGPVVPHPMAGPAFAALLDRLVQSHRFVIVELPDVGLRPEGRSVLGVIDGAQLVVCRMLGSKASVREAIGAVQNSGARLLGGVLQPPAIAAPPLRDVD